MLEKFEDYLGVLSLTQVIKDRIDEVIELNTKIKNDDILDIFICEMKNNEGARTYTSLWLFTDKFFIECKDFLTTNNFDLIPYLGAIKYCSIETIEFDLDVASEKSSVKTYCEFENKLNGNFIATENNCVKAFDIYLKYIVANLKE